MNHYWVHNFNSTSSLLGGAVEAGDAGNTAIYYNPATLTQMQKGSNLSLAANLFSWNFYNFKNALGNDIHIKSDNFLVQPQFISYTYSPKKMKGLSFAFAALTRVKERMEMGYSNATYTEVLERYPGPEKYNTTFHYRNDYTDSWVGGALAHKVNDRFSYGLSTFISFSTLNYNYSYAAYAYNAQDTSGIIDFRLSEGSYSEQVKFTDYRLVFKLGFSYELEQWKFGLTVTTPNIKVFSGGKSATRVAEQTNIAYDGELLPDYIAFDGQSKSELKTNYKLPWSIAFGFIHDIPDKGRRFYFTTEFFSKIKGYKMVDAQQKDDVATPGYEDAAGDDWLSFGYAARPIINFSVGYSWTIKKDLVFLNAFRTDFSAINRDGLDDLDNLNYIKTTDYNIYHYSAGVEFSIKRQRFIAGGDFGFGFKMNQQQIANFSDPVEYNPENNRALQGPLNYNSNIYYFGFSFYVGATLNFIKDDTKPKK